MSVKYLSRVLNEINPPKPHSEILTRLLEQVRPLDFLALAYPEIETLRRELKEAEATTGQTKEIQKQLDKFSLTQRHYIVLCIENVLRLAKRNKWDLCKNNDFLYLYNGAFWKELDKETFQKFLGEAAERMGVAKFSARYYKFKEELFKQFLSAAYLPTPEPKKDTVLINLKNGTFEITPNGACLRSFDRLDFLTYQLNFEYDPNARAPIFQNYLNKVLPDPQRQKVLAEYMGYVFIKHGSNTLKEEKALILYGTGANGKSVFFEVVNALLGSDNVSNFSLQSLTNDSGYFRAKLANKLVNYASEINDNLEASIFKQLVSGEPVEARLPFGQPFILKDYAKLIFNCNDLPKDVEQSNAYFRRFLIIPFDVTIPEHEQDKNLHSKIIDNELSGVLNWVLEGLKRLLQQKGFSECKAAQQALEQYRLESDTVRMFVNENAYKVSSVKITPLKDMFNDYRVYCIEGGFKACSLKTFSERLRNIGFLIERRGFGMAVFAEKIM